MAYGSDRSRFTETHFAGKRLVFEAVNCCNYYNSNYCHYLQFSQSSVILFKSKFPQSPKVFCVATTRMITDRKEIQSHMKCKCCIFRAVEDKDIGPLVKTIMTRCIHCTRLAFLYWFNEIPEIKFCENKHSLVLYLISDEVPLYQIKYIALIDVYGIPMVTQ